MNIGKTEGFMWTLILISPSISVYYVATYWTPWPRALLTIFVVGMLIHHLRKIPPGTETGVTFFGKLLEKRWADGMCFVPTIFGTLQRFGIDLGWNIVQAPNRNEYIRRREHYVHIDSRTPSYQVRGNTSVFWIELMNAVRHPIRWFTTLHPDYIQMDLGFRIALLAVIAGVVSHFLIPYAHPTLRPPQGSCAILPNGGAMRIAASTLPTEFTNIDEPVMVIYPVPRKDTWSNIQQKARGNQLDESMVLITWSSRKDEYAKVCF